MSSRLKVLVGAAVLTASLLGVAAAPGMAANTRVTNFGSTPCTGVLVTCPTAPVSASEYAYPYGTVGSLTTTGQAVAGQLSFTPVTAGNSTATDIVIKNLAPSTLTQVHVSGGSQAPKSINPGSVMTTPGEIDPALCNSSTGACLPSLPPGLYYQAVYVVANPSAIAVSCPLTPAAGLDGLYDGLNCSIGNLASQQGLTLRVVIKTTTATTLAVEPWFALQLKEGSSATGSNSDVFLSYGRLSVAPASCDNVSNFFLTDIPISLSNIDQPTPCTQTTKVETTTGFTYGTLATVGSVTSTLCLPNVSCFGQLSTSSILAGASITGGVKWTIVWSASLVRNGGPKGAIHFLDAYPTDPNAYERISFKTTDKCGSTLVKMCWLTFTKNADGSYTTQIWTPSNGSIRGN
ncbi:MAG: hypothetical protein ACJ778_13170 [Chloroflexota bacterium]